MYVAEMEFELSANGQARFQVLRNNKAAKDVVKEEAK